MTQTTAIVLAKGAPNRCRDGSITMCAILLSDDLGLIRVYPLSVFEDSQVKIWTRLQLKLDRSKTDNRDESYKVVGYQLIDKIESPNIKREILDACVLKSGYDDPIDYQNENRKSIAVVKCKGNLGASLIPRESKLDPMFYNTEDGLDIMTQSQFPFKPYIEWYSEQRKEKDKPRRTHLCGQEIYFAMKKNASTPFRIFENLRVGDPDYDHWIILGNMKDNRSTWLAPHIHRQKKTTQSTMFTNLGIRDGKSEDWPYSVQGDENVRNADPQKTFNFTI